jgi:O-antigen ligase
MPDGNPSHLTMERRLEARVRLVAWLALAPIIALPFLHRLGVTFEWSYPKLFALQTAALIVWAGLLLVRPVRIVEMGAASGVGLPMLAILIWATLSIGWSGARWTAVQPLVELTFMALAVVGFATLFTVARIRRWFTRAYAVSATLACLVFVIAYPLSQSAMRVYPFANPNVAAAFALMPLVVGAAYVLSARVGRVSKRAGLCGGVMAVCAGAAIIVSGSAAALAAGAGGVALAALFSARGRARRRVKLTLALVVGVALALPLAAPKWSREQLGARPAMWRGALELASDQPVRGLGVGSFFVEYARVYPVEYAAHKYRSDIVENAHSLPLHVVVELGVIGVALGLWLILAAAKNAIVAHSHLGPSGRTLLYGLVAGSLAMLAQGAVSTSLHQVGCAIHLVIALALIGGLTTVRWRPVAAPHGRSRVLGIVCAVALLAAYVFTAGRGVRSQFYLHRAWTMPPDRVTRRIADFKHAVCCTWPNLSTLRARYKLASIYQRAGHYESALRELQTLDTLAPNIGGVRADQAVVLLRLGRIQPAARAIISYCRKNPLDKRAYLIWTDILRAAVKAGQTRLAEPGEALDLLTIADTYDSRVLPRPEIADLMKPFRAALRQIEQSTP